MRIRLLTAILATTVSIGTAQAQSSNTSSNSSSNNGVVRERIVDSYCDNGWCERSVQRRVYRDDNRRNWRSDRRYARSEWRRYREGERRYRQRDHDDDDD